MPNKTQNYQLNQYQLEDNFLRTDFNEDNQKVDAALGTLAAEKAELVFGVYAGNSVETRTVPLGFTPKAVLLISMSGHVYDSQNVYGGLFFPGHPLKTVGNKVAAEIVTGGFRVHYLYSDHLYANTSSYDYHYVAVK